MKISTILDQIDMGSVALPEFQRGYVWNRDQVKGLVSALYRRHPVGSLLVWATKTEGAPSRGDGPLQPGVVELLLDGQQRMTSLYGLVRGKPPAFFDGNAQAFTGLFFNLEDESFEFHMPSKMKDDPLWLSVTRVLQKGAAEAVKPFLADPERVPKLSIYLERLNRLATIPDVELHTEKVTGEDKTVDVVVDIFNNVNSGGTKLSKGDLALAKMCAAWSEARGAMRHELKRWRGAGFDFKLEWLLRCVTAQETGQSFFTALDHVTVPQFQAGLKKSASAVDTLLNLVASRLGLDHGQVLGSVYAFPLMVRYLAQNGGQFRDHQERDKLLYWYVHTLMWGRYSGSTESILNQDLTAIRDHDHALDELLGLLRRNRGDLKVKPEDFRGWSRGARFYPLLYLLTRVHGAKDWGSGLELTSHLLGQQNRLHIHHIFPKALLYKAGYERSEVNAIGNFTFLTQETNLQVSDRDPAVYLPEYVAKSPGAVESHWIPTDPQLWQISRYRDFLAARRELLAQAANQFLESLYSGAVAETAPSPSILDQVVPPMPGSISDAAEELVLKSTNEWVVAQGLAEGELAFELQDAQTGEPLAYLDLAWPNGLQPGLTQPVALVLGEDGELHEIANRAGYRLFLSQDDLAQHIQREILKEQADVPH